MAAADAEPTTAAKNGTTSRDAGFEQALSEVEHAVEAMDVEYIDTTPLIAALSNGPLEIEQVGRVSGLDPAELGTGIERLEKLGMVSHAQAGGRDVLSLTSVGIAASG